MFVDTNVLMVARSAKVPNRQAALDAFSRERRTETLRISRQVVRGAVRGPPGRQARRKSGGSAQGLGLCATAIEAAAGTSERGLCCCGCGGH